MFKYLKLRGVWTLLFLFLISLIFFWKFFFKGLIPFPGDMLVGAYYPWLDHKWGGFITSVPVKNPEITDVFSQIYLWKKLIIDSFKSHTLPLWNPYSFSGYPLLANFQSSFLNPFNLLMLIFSSEYGWGLIVFSQFLFASFTMFFFLKKIYKNNFSALAGSITYAYSGFMIAWSQFATAGFAMIWLPLIFLNIHIFFENKKLKNLLYLPVLYFLLMTSGHFQALVYGFIFSGAYFLYKFLSQKYQNIKIIISFFLISLISFGLMAVQLLPTVELGSLSVRFSENYISQFNFGLLSLDRLITIFAPDYFGNPNTMNFWGTFNYYETVFYSGVISVFAIIFCLFNFKKTKNEKFFLVSAITALLFSFNTPLGRLIYQLNIPGLSTSSAGRINMIFVFSVSVLVAYFLNHISIHKFKNTFRFYWGYFIFTFIIALFTLWMYRFSLNYPDLHQNYYVSLRNLVLPVILTVFVFLILSFIKNKKTKSIFILSIIILDLFRFGWKYTPFVNKEYFYPQTEISNFLNNQEGLFRIEKEKGPLLPPNTWTAYKLSSPAGYDPMSLDKYSRFYKEYLNNENKIINTSRYSEINIYDAKKLGEANVKYLLAFKYDQNNKISPGNGNLNRNINPKDWSKIYEYGSVVVLENKYFKPRIEINNSKNQKTLNNLNYNNNEISFNIDSDQNNQNLIIRDTWFPGWKAFINNQQVNINKYLGIYRQIKLPAGEKIHVEFKYQPKTFKTGLQISLITFVVWLFLILKLFKNDAE